MSCKTHSKYQAVGKPRSMCRDCWDMWEMKEAARLAKEVEENKVSTMCYHPASDLTLREIALGIHEDRIFTNRHCRDIQEVLMCFPILSMMELCDRKWIANNPPGLVWEFYHAASPTGVNGLPMFFSVRFLSPEDARTMEGYLLKLREAKAEFMQG
jgi:hypothetical protein